MGVRTVLAALALGLLLAAPAAAGTGMFVGAAEDNARSLDPLAAKSKLDLAAIAGLGTVRMTSIWTPGETIVGGDELVALRNAATAARFDGIRLVLSIYPRDRRTTPLSSRARGEFAQYAASVARLVPGINDFIVGNEPNLNLFWMPQFGARGSDLAAPSYELLLAKTYDALKSVSPEINVIGGALSPRGQDKPGSVRQTHSPTAFIADLGAAYRKSGRTRPIMDMFAIHPYLIPSRLAPTFAHPRTTTIGIADYPKLVGLLKSAFAGTAQPGATLPIIYDEFGYQSLIPARKRSLYTHLGTAAARDAITESRQALYYRQAVALAQCQPTVAGMLIFHVVDESDANAWQSGVYYADDTPKTSMDGVRQAALAARDGSVAQCAAAKTASSLESVVFHDPPAAPGPLQIDLSCSSACAYRVQVLDVQTGEGAVEAGGDAVGEQTVSIPAESLAPGTYQYVLRVFTDGKPGTATMRYSRPFTIPPPAPGQTATTSTPPPPPQPLLPLVPSLPTLEPTVPATAPPGASG
ncbi:MAG TPA: hypothetical protein VLN26_17665 [Gaiellaceae bacterium]|nr:hypothetical protein [Gaiellaceae bacterium]